MKQFLLYASFWFMAVLALLSFILMVIPSHGWLYTIFISCINGFQLYNLINLFEIVSGTKIVFYNEIRMSYNSFAEYYEHMEF